MLAAGSAPLPMLKYRDRLPVAESDPWADSTPYGSVCAGSTERAGPRTGPPAWWTPCGKG